MLECIGPSSCTTCIFTETIMISTKNKDNASKRQKLILPYYNSSQASATTPQQSGYASSPPKALSYKSPRHDRAMSQ